MKKNYYKLAVALLALTTTPVFAQYYLGASVGRVDHKQNRTDWAAAGSTTTYVDVDTAFKVFGGYKFNQYLGVEAAYNDFGRYVADLQTGTDAGKATVKTDAFSLFGVGTVALPNNLSLFGKIGISRNSSRMTFASQGIAYRASDSGNSNRTSFAFGGGAAYAINKNVSVRLEGESFGNAGDTNNAFTTAGKSSNSNPKMISAGLQYAF